MLRFNKNRDVVTTFTYQVMRLCCSCRSVSRLWRYWSGLSLSRASFASWESVLECEIEQSTEAPIHQDDQSRHSWQIADKITIRKLLREFGKSSAVKRVAEEHLLTGSAYRKTLKSFTSHVLFQSHPDLRKLVSNVLNNEGHIDDLLPYFLNHARQKNPLSGPVLELSLTSDLSQPTNWYPWARALKRRIYYHAGPTNSGKTHAAMERFKAASSGIYCAPLRMLAHEIFHRCNQEGIPCDLQTGEEMQFASQDESQLSPHFSCTVEIVPVTQDHVYDVAVIDEIQMIEDPNRGGAWTRAFLGVPAREVHVCGHGCSVDLVERLASLMGEQVEVSRYERLAPLAVEKRGLSGKYSAVRPGDCVIAFSRRNVFEIRRRIESATRLKCAVVYGNLPPATRVQQAQLFNDPQSDCRIMVATDAVGMGLNLNIRRIVFHTLEKYDGADFCPLTSAHAKQIAGRAGRYGLDHSAGLVTTFHNSHLDQLKELLSAPVDTSKQAGLYPSPEQIKIFSSHLPHAKLPDILVMFARMAHVDDNYFLCDMGDQKDVASELSSVPMTIMDHFTFSRAPVDTSKRTEIGALKQFAELYASGEPVVYEHVKKLVGLRGKPRRVGSVFRLAKLEDQHSITDLYLWLSMRFPESFTDAERVSELQSELEKGIADSLSLPKLRVSNRNKWRPQADDTTEMQQLLEHGALVLTKAQRKHVLAKMLRETRRKMVHSFINKRRNRM